MIRKASRFTMFPVAAPPAYNRLLVYWQKFDPAAFEYEFDEDELAAHGINVDEAAEVFWNGFEVMRNKRQGTGYQIIGLTDAGRVLKVIAYEKRKGLIRVITGWPV